ncbi:uncharacterized protein [Drosophila kikkawai]|uniref:Uncharacterized protein n=1 Tax=Drosophila kikkawai TaxID=30033 RepID=A0A6P4ICD1_DROKI|nr:uncharacterized protein LOC108077154 [Drosophila kikkawai]
MTINNWCKLANDASKATPEDRPKVLPGLDCLDDRLQAVLREQGWQKSSHKRKPAGGGQKRRKAKKAKTKFSTPRFQEYQKLYADNLRDLKRCAAGNEYKFRSRPVPDFQRSHQLLQKRQQYLCSLKKLTKPKSPRTLATSMEALVKRKNKERQLKRQASNSTPKTNPSSSMDYMLRQPFRPRTECSFTRPKPFQLHTKKRALGRFLYDKEKRVRMETRCVELANEWLKSERREFIRLRKLTNFKANPSPWRKKKIIHNRG